AALPETGPAARVLSRIGALGARAFGGGGRSAYATRDLTTGSIPRTLVFLAWPHTVEGVLRIADHLVDLALAGVFGHKFIAGMGAAQQFSQVGFTARMGFDIGMRAMVSRAIGMGDTELANRVVMQAATITVGYSVVMALIGLFLTETLLGILGLSEGVIVEGAGYMKVIFVGQAAIAFQVLTANALGASGDTLTPMKASIVMRVTHIALSPILMFGLLGAPHMGLVGAAVANVASQALATTILLGVLFAGTSRLKLSLKGYRVDWPLLRQLLRVGLPASVTGVERSFAQLLLMGLVVQFGDVAVALFALSRRIEMFSHGASQGVAQASGIMVGQSIGRGVPERAKTTVLWAGAYALGVNIVLAALIAAFPIAILSIFTRDAELLELGAGWLMIQTVGYVGVGLGLVAGHTLQVAGATFFVMLVAIGSMWALEFPLALVLSRGTDLGPYGIAWAMVAAMLVRPLLYIPYFLSGRWLRHRLFSHERRGGH
ncbi:MAG: family efflux transporter, partial [Chloroflexi bacterium]|nr:family efflux transporter [Chloroflexota bacterium]